MANQRWQVYPNLYTGPSVQLAYYSSYGILGALAWMAVAIMAMYRTSQRRRIT